MNQSIKNWYRGKNIKITSDQMTYTTINEKGESTTRMLGKIFSLFDFECIVGNMHVENTRKKGEVYKRNDLENNEIPYLVFPVYFYLVEKGAFPTIEQATASYLQIYCDKIEKGKYKFKDEFDVEGNPIFTSNDIRNRMYRSYFSFVREIHLLLSLMQYKDIEVEYDFVTDTSDGLDIIARHNGRTVYIASYVGTRSSLSWKSCKNNSKHDYSSFQVIDAIAWMNGLNQNTTQLGEAWVYSKKEIQNIHDAIVDAATTEKCIA